VVKSGIRNKRIWCLILGFCFIGLGQNMNAVELTNMQVDRKGDRFYMNSTLLVEAPIESMLAILLDYNNLHQFSRGIVHSQVVTPDDDDVRRVYTHIRGCVAFICRSIERIEKLEVFDEHRIVATLVPELSKNVAWNLSTWELERVSVKAKQANNKPVQLTRIHYTLEFEPDFWVPPIIGGYLVKKSLSEDGVEILSRMEAHAQGKFPLVADKNRLQTFPHLKTEDLDFVSMQKPEHPLEDTF
jgi:hypothetical protein